MKFIIFNALLFLSFRSFCQNKDTVHVCSLLNDKPSVMAFSIPARRCVPDSQGLKLTVEQINRRFVANAKEIGVTSFRINEYHFIEIIYKSKLCDTVAVLFVTKKGENEIKSNGYKTNYLNTDFRMSEKENEIIIYRKIKNKGKEATVSFELNRATFKIDSFMDDGLSIW